jgi:hypothetical protein
MKETRSCKDENIGEQWLLRNFKDGCDPSSDALKMRHKVAF